MKVLVTGGAGFIGSHLCKRLLVDGHTVWVFDNLDSAYSPDLKRRNLSELEMLGKPFTFVCGDIMDGPALDATCSSIKFDQVIHLAGCVGIRPSLTNPALYQRVNVEGTVNVLEAARASKIKKIIIASSASVYGTNCKLPFAEADPIFAPISPYAASKIACEGLGHVWHHIYGMDVVMLRFFTVYGPRQRPNLAIYRFTDLICAGKPIQLFGDGTTARDYTYITDILDGIIACTERDFGFAIFNLGESQPVTLIHLVELIEAALGRKAIIDKQSIQPGDMHVTFADISKARAKLNYNPQVTIEQGINLFTEWFRTTRGQSRD